MACRDAGGAMYAGTASAVKVMTLSESFFEPLVAGDQKVSGQSFSIALPIQELRGLPCLGSFSVSQHVRHIEGLPWLGSYSVHRQVRHLVGQPLYCSAAGAGSVGSRGYGDGSAHYVTQQYRLASMAAWLSSTGISQHDLLPHIPSIRLSTVNSSSYPGIVPQFLNSIS